MTNEELDKARAEEACRLWGSLRGSGASSPSIVAARLARENWTPPEPVDPDVLAFREWVSRQHPLLLPHNMDFSHLENAYLAGARMAREKEQERAKGLVEYVQDLTILGSDDSISAISWRARATLSKYRGEV